MHILEHIVVILHDENSVMHSLGYMADGMLLDDILVMHILEYIVDDMLHGDI